jgi:hypothetical protein
LEKHTAEFIKQATLALQDKTKTEADIEKITVSYLQSCSPDSRPEDFTHPEWEALFNKQDDKQVDSQQVNLKDHLREIENPAKKTAKIVQLLIHHPKVISCAGLLRCLTRVGSDIADEVFDLVYADKFSLWNTTDFKQKLYARLVTSEAGIQSAEDVTSAIRNSTKSLLFHSEMNELGERLIVCANKYKNSSNVALRNYLFAEYLDYMQETGQSPKTDENWKTAQALYLCLEALSGKDYKSEHKHSRFSTRLE